MKMIQVLPTKISAMSQKQSPREKNSNFSKRREVFCGNMRDLVLSLSSTIVLNPVRHNEFLLSNTVPFYLKDRYEVLEFQYSSHTCHFLLARDRKNNDQCVIKVIPKIYKLEYEISHYKKLLLYASSCSRVVGFSKLIDSCSDQPLQFVVLQKLGESFAQCHRKMGNFDFFETLHAGYQLVDRIEHLHSKGFLHLHISPHNLFFGRTPHSKTLYLFNHDFHVPYLDRNGNHLQSYHPEIFNPPSCAVANRFASIHILHRHGGSRRDDMESFLYTLVYLHTSKMPWKIGDISSYKEQIRVRGELGDDYFKDLHPVFLQLARAILRLNFEEEPDYEQCRRILKCEMWTSRPSFKKYVFG